MFQDMAEQRPAEGFLQGLMANARLDWRLFTDRNIGWREKIVPAAVVLMITRYLPELFAARHVRRNRAEMIVDEAERWGPVERPAPQRTEEQPVRDVGEVVHG